ncbi:MAG: Mbeg1-like protein [Eubacterium sp.]
MLTHSELNMLSQLTALNLPHNAHKLPISVSDMVIYHHLHRQSLSGAAAMSTEEWIHSLGLIRSNPKLMALKIIGSVNQPLNGLFGFCFTSDKPNTGIICFRGTVGIGGWLDNYKGGFIADTPQQKNALLFLKRMQNQFDFSHFDLAGHSKGGNNAQYITILYSPFINRCVSFNSPGFSGDFVKKYYPKIIENRKKITAYEGAYDIVNILLNSIAGQRIVIETGSKTPKDNHKPNHILDPNGSIAHLGKRHPLYASFQNMTIGLTLIITILKKYLKTFNSHEKDPPHNHSV